MDAAVAGLLGAFIGAAGALVGVRWQLDAAARSEKEERIFNARREVYAEIMGVLNYSFLKGQDLNTFLADKHFRTKFTIHIADCFSRARILATASLRQKLYELYGVESKLWEPENTAQNPELTAKRTQLALDVEVLIRQELGIEELV